MNLRTKTALVRTLVLAVPVGGPVAVAQTSKPPTAPATKPDLPETPLPKPAPAKQPFNLPTGQFSSSQPSGGPVFYNPDPNAQVTVLEDTLIRVRTDQPLSSRYAKDGEPVLFSLSEDVVVDNMLVIPRGATVHGEVIQKKKAGVITGSPELTLKLVSLEFAGRRYSLYTYQFRVQGASKTKPTEQKVKGGAVIGAVVGGVFSGSAKGETTATGKLAGMGAGAALGAGVGALTSAATPGPTVTLPAESQMDFHLASPISVRPATAKEAEQLSHRVGATEPILYVHGDTP